MGLGGSHGHLAVQQFDHPQIWRYTLAGLFTRLAVHISAGPSRSRNLMVRLRRCAHKPAKRDEMRTLPEITLEDMTLAELILPG
jgi:hypothetical protein